MPRERETRAYFSRGGSHHQRSPKRCQGLHPNVLEVTLSRCVPWSFVERAAGLLTNEKKKKKYYGVPRASRGASAGGTRICVRCTQDQAKWWRQGAWSLVDMWQNASGLSLISWLQKYRRMTKIGTVVRCRVRALDRKARKVKGLAAHRKRVEIHWRLF